LYSTTKSGVDNDVDVDVDVDVDAASPAPPHTEEQENANGVAAVVVFTFAYVASCAAACAVAVVSSAAVSPRTRVLAPAATMAPTNACHRIDRLLDWIFPMRIVPYNTILDYSYSYRRRYL